MHGRKFDTHHTRTAAGLAVLAALCAAANLTKPVHMDDAAYLPMVHWIISHPLHPMLGQLNWGDTAQPFSVVNQPLLYIYLEALVQAVFGPSLLAQHVLMAVMSAAVVVVFYEVARHSASQHPLRDTALLVLGPAFLPGQNLMMDVPTLLCWLICFWALLGPPNRQTTGRLIAGAVAVAAGLLIKYTSLVLLPIFAITLLRRGQWRRLWVLAIPLAALAGWSAFNLFDYGAVHVLTRSAGDPRLSRHLALAADWVAGIGAVAPFAVAFAMQRSPARRWTLLAAGLTAAATWLAVSLWQHSLWLGLGWGVLIGNGCLALLLAARAVVKRGLAGPGPSPDDINFVLVLWLAGAGTFVVLFTPFMAIRHVLLALPALILLLGHNLDQNARLAWAGLALTVALGAWLAVADFAYAQVYEVNAAEIAARLPGGATHWTVGHWGWQWYAEKAGMVEYDSNRSTLEAGDYLVAATVPGPQGLRPEDKQRLLLVETIRVDASPLTWLRSMSAPPIGGYYDYSIARGVLPWTFSSEAVEVFRVFLVK